MIKATYENIPTGSMQNSTTSGNYAQDFVNWNDFKTQRTVPKYATLEPDRNWLDGTFLNFPDNPQGLGYMSTIMSDANGDFSNPIVITREYSNVYTAPGLMIEFDTGSDDHALDMNVKYYRDNTLLSDEDYEVDSSMYFCDNPVQAYNKIVITITSMSNPYRFLKIFNISDGIVREFYEEEIENLEIIEQIDSNNQALSINQSKTRILPLSRTGILFQRTLPYRVYRNDVLFGNFFISTSKANTDKSIYEVTADDYVGVLSNQMHLGGMYSNVSASTLIADVCGDVPYELDVSLSSKTISGYLPIQTRREALRMVAFVLNAMVDTSRSDKIIIKPLPSVVSSTIGEDRIVSIETTEENITTKYEIQNVLYKANNESTEIFRGQISGDTYITFSSPMHSLSITGGTIVTSSANYAIITGSGTVVLSGKGYDEVTQTSSKSNPNTVTTDLEKIESVESTLTCDTEALLSAYEFIQFKIKASFKMLTEKVGDIVNLNGQQARILSLSYNLSNLYATAEMEAYYG